MYGVKLPKEKPLEVVTRDGAAIRLGWKPFGVGNPVTEPFDAAAAQGLVNGVGNVHGSLVLPAPVTIAVDAAHRGGQVLTAAETDNYQC